MTRQVEPEWDDATRVLAEGLKRHDVESCPGCRIHKSILDDPENNGFTFHDDYCAVCAGQDAYGRWLAAMDADEADGKKPSDFAKPGDGRHVYLRRMTPEEMAERTA